jgi:sporulation protein YlmC with PRC-barrel domain
MDRANPVEASLTGHVVVDSIGDKIGVIDDVLFDAETQAPAWAFVKRGLLHPRPAIMPLSAGYQAEDGAVVVPYDKHTVWAAPKVDDDHVLTKDAERVLMAHYASVE